MADFKFEIVEQLGVACAGNPMNIELNLISWNGRKPTLDLRKWDEDHERMSKGFTLTKVEVDALRDMLNSLTDNEEG